MAETQQFGMEDVKRILTERVGMEEDDIPEDPNTSFEDMGLDSLAFVDIQLAMQQEYGIEIPDEDAEKITTISQSLEYVNQRLAEKESE